MNVDGMKIGYIDKVGYNLVVLVINLNMCLIFVVMGVLIYKGCEVESKKLF